MKNTVVFDVAASASAGGGHVYRGVALAETFRNFGMNCVFRIAQEYEGMFPVISENGFECADISVLQKDQFHLLVLDNYEYDSGFEKSQKSLFSRILVIDDLANRLHECNYLCDYTSGRQEQDYIGLVPKNCKLMLGGGYALLGKSFQQQRNSIKIRDKKKNILVSMGYTDIVNATSMAVDALSHCQATYKVTVVVTDAMPHREEVTKTARNAGFTVVENASDMSGLIAEADLAIGAAGLSSVERCSLGLPSLLIQVADNQKYNIRSLAEDGVALDLGNISELDSKSLSRKISALKDEDVECMSQKCLQMYDCMGPQRVMTGILPILTGDLCGHVNLRFTEMSDCDFVYQLQTIPETRKFSRDPETPDYDAHVQWLREKIHSRECLHMQIESEGSRCGVICLENRNDRNEVSIYLSPEFYNRGIASTALKILRTGLPGLDLHAYINQQNTASVSLFRNSGYRQKDTNWWVSGAIQ